MKQPRFYCNNSEISSKGLKSSSSLGPKIWELLPLEIRETETFLQFKANIKKWNPQSCPCRSCIICLLNVGYIEANKQRKRLSFLSWISLSNES